MANFFSSYLKKIVQPASDKTIFCFLYVLHILFESLPISSSAHLSLLNNYSASLTNRKPLLFDEETTDLMHLPTAIVTSIFLILWALLFQPSREYLYTLGVNTCIAVGITGLFYLFLRYVKLQNKFPVEYGLFTSGCILLSLYFCPVSSQMHISASQAAVIGVSQSLALLPGISRLGITCSSALWMGIDPYLSVVFSLLIELPLIAAALARLVLINKKKLTFFACSLPAVIVSSCCSLGFLFLVVVCLKTKLIVLFGIYLIAIAAPLLAQ